MTSDEAAKAEEFRQEVRSWLMENLPEGWGTPGQALPQFRRRGLESAEIRKERHERGKLWVKKLYEARYTAFGYPKEYGGHERPEWEKAIIRQEMSRTGTPAGPMSNVMVAGPTILVSGQEWQKKRFLPKMLSGEECWMQGFSEPNAGSDLANVQMTAVRDGDEWVINGQKVWNSLWEFAEFAVLVVKTDPEAPRHRNLSYFIVDLKQPGYEARPLRQMTGGSEFSEMFFDNYRVPHENLIGELNMGWYAAMATLVNERDGGGGWDNVALLGGQGVSGLGGMDTAVALAKRTKRYGKSLWEDDSFRQRIAQLAIESVAQQHSGARAVARLAKGIPMADEVNIFKLFRSEYAVRSSDVMFEIIGAYSQLWRGPHSINDGAAAMMMLASRGGTIAAGTSEINRNVIAERILGLPRIKAK